MPAFLSPEWIEALVAAVGDAHLPDATIGVEAGSVKFSVVARNGAIAETALGPRADADFTFTITEPDARAVLAGDVRPDEAFMQGRLKAAGAMDRVLAVLEWSATPDYAEALERVRALTD